VILILKKHTFLPVIHVEEKEQAITQTRIAFDNGADGVFLINHFFGHSRLFEIYGEIRKLFGNEWIGINCLDLEPIEVIRNVPKDVNGVWVDNAFVDEELGYDEQEYASEVLDTILSVKWTGLYFGGVAFKYQRQVKDLIKATEIACRYMDIITTSGEGTGIPAQVKKIEIMSEIAHKNKKKIAIASEITPENVNHYKMADVFMVATGISYDFTRLNPQLVKKLRDNLRDE